MQKKLCRVKKRIKKPEAREYALLFHFCEAVEQATLIYGEKYHNSTYSG